MDDAQFVFESLLHQVQVEPRDFQFFDEWNLTGTLSLAAE
jgi:hypothetical protein